MGQNEKDKILEDIEIIDFEDDINSKTSEIEIIEETPKPSNENKINSNKKTKEKIKIKPILVSILVFFLLFGVVFALPFISDYFEAKKNPTINVDMPSKENTNNNEVSNYKSGIDVTKVLNDIKEMKSYTFENNMNIYVKDNKNETLTIENNYIYSFNETKYKIKTNKIIADFSYDTVDYYEKINDNYYTYINDITTKEYNKQDITLDDFNILYNIFGNTINHLLNDYKILNEKKIIVDNKSHINITLKTSLDLLKNVSVETNRVQSKIDMSKFNIQDINVDLYFDENKDLYKIEFIIEEKSAYQENIEGEIESLIINYTFKDFNKVKDISIPSDL